MRKFFKAGDHVKVIAGQYEGDTGLIVRVDDDIVVLFSDLTMHEAGVLSSRLSGSVRLHCKGRRFAVESSCEGRAAVRRRGYRRGQSRPVLVRRTGAARPADRRRHRPSRKGVPTSVEHARKGHCTTCMGLLVQT